MLNFRKLKQDLSPNILKEGRALFERDAVVSAKIVTISPTNVRLSCQVLGQFESVTWPRSPPGFRSYNQVKHMTERPKNPASPRVRKQTPEPAEDLASIMSSKVVGQPNVINVIVPYIEMFQAGLAPENRPVGVFLLLGPTGTGKTRTVEALAETLHGSSRNVLKIDCGEFQMEHEVAKLIGAPPGYLGHRETQPMLSQQKLTERHERQVRLVAGAVRRNRESGSVVDPSAARRARSRRPATRRQLGR